MKATVLAFGLTAVLAAVIGLSLALSPAGAQAQGQASPAAPSNVARRLAAQLGLGRIGFTWLQDSRREFDMR